MFAPVAAREIRVLHKKWNQDTGYDTRVRKTNEGMPAMREPCRSSLSPPRLPRALRASLFLFVAVSVPRLQHSLSRIPLSLQPALCEASFSAGKGHCCFRLAIDIASSPH